MSKEPSQSLDFLAQEFMDSRKKPELASAIPETDESIRTLISTANDPTETAGEILQKILSLVDPSNPTDTRITLDATRVVVEATAKALKKTIDIDPETGKPVIRPGFNPRAKFG